MRPLSPWKPFGPNELPPYDLNSESDMTWFHLATTSLNLKFQMTTVRRLSAQATFVTARLQATHSVFVLTERGSSEVHVY